MTSILTPIERCAAIAGLRGHEIVLGVIPSDKHERMLARYRRAAPNDAARKRLVAEIRDAVDVGASLRAADLLIVLRRLLADGDYSEARLARAAASRRRTLARWRQCGPKRGVVSSLAAQTAQESATVLSWRGRSPNPLSESVV